MFEHLELIEKDFFGLQYADLVPAPDAMVTTVSVCTKQPVFPWQPMILESSHDSCFPSNPGLIWLLRLRVWEPLFLSAHSNLPRQPFVSQATGGLVILVLRFYEQPTPCNQHQHFLRNPVSRPGGTTTMTTTVAMCSPSHSNPHSPKPIHPTT